MKHTLTMLSLLLMIFSVQAQAPQGFNYQAALRNGSGNPISSTNVILRFSIIEGSASGTVLYQETQGLTTNAQGLVTAVIGKGTVVSGDFLLDWGANSYFIKTEVNPGSGFVDMGTQQLISVPYALHADKARIAEIAAQAEGLNPGVLVLLDQLAGGGGSSGQILKYDGSKWAPADPSLDLNQLKGGSATNGQILQWNGSSWTPADPVTYTPGAGITFNSGVINSVWNRKTSVSTSDIYQATTGRLGLGTSNPVARLHVENGSGKMAGLYTSNVSTVGSDSGTLAVFNGYTGNGFNAAITASVVGTSSYAAYLKSKWRGVQVDVTGNASGIGMGGVYNVDNTGTSNYGVYAVGKNATTENYGLYGYAIGTGSTNFGVMGFGDGNNQVYGVRGWSQGTGTNYGVVGRGLNGTTNYGLYCVGNGVYTGTWSSSSDRKLKSNLKPLTGSLDMVMKLSPLSYTFRTDDSAYKCMDLAKGTHFGFIAQELELVLPELVSNNVHHDPETKKTIDYKGVNYTEMVPILTKAIQEQNALLQQQAELIKALAEKVKQLEGIVVSGTVKTN